MDDLDHLISFLDLLGEEVNTAELVSILESCDFLHLSPEDFACLQELGDPAQAAALFTPTKGTTGFHQRSVQEDSQPQEQHAAEGESQKQDSEGSLLKAGHPIKGTRLAARLHEASSSSAREQPAENEIDVPFDSNGEADGKIDSSAENLFTLQASKSVGMVRCACGQVYCFLESNPCPVCGGHDPLGFLWASHSSEIIAKLQSQIVNACCQSPMGLFSVLDSIQSKLEQALARTRDPTALAGLATLARHEVANRMMKFFDQLFEVPFLTTEAIQEVKTAAGKESGRYHRNSGRSRQPPWQALDWRKQPASKRVDTHTGIQDNPLSEVDRYLGSEFDWTGP